MLCGICGASDNDINGASGNYFLNHHTERQFVCDFDRMIIAELSRQLDNSRQETPTLALREAV